MKIRDMDPTAPNKSVEELFRTFGYDKTLFPNFRKVADYYVEHLPLWKVLNYYMGADELDEYTEEYQVPCLLPDHGSGDYHRSARYYMYDRETEEESPAVYCFKCSSVKNSFSLLMEKERNEDGKLIDVFNMIEEKWGVPFPKDIILDFDPDTYFVFEDDESVQRKKKIKDALLNASEIEKLKGNSVEYIEAIKLIYKQGGYLQA